MADEVEDVGCPCGVPHSMDQHLGKSHISQRENVPITYCNMCQHWFSYDDRRAWFGRSLGFLMEKIGGKKPGCCGPAVEVEP